MEYFKIVNENILKLEADKQIRDILIKDIPLWGELRRIIAYEYYNLNKPSEKKKRKSNMKNLLKIFDFPFSVYKGDATNIIVEGHRKILIEKKYDDPLTLKIKSELSRKNERYISIERDSFAGEYKKKFNKSFYNTQEKSLYRRYFQKNIKFNDLELQKLKQLINKVNRQFESELINFESIKPLIINHISDCNYYISVLSKLHIKNIYLPMSYIDTSIIIAAKELGIYVSDIQYALFNKYHIGYGMNNLQGDEKYLPDEYLLWSKKWEKDYLPEVKSYQVLESPIIDKAICKDKKKQILVVSQDFIANEMYQFALSLSEIKQLKDYEIVLKQHPWEQEIKSDKIKIITSTQDINLQDEINKSEVVITSFSTALYEAIHFECKVLIYDNGYSYMYDEDITSYKINNGHEVFEKLKNYKQIPGEYYSKTEYNIRNNTSDNKLIDEKDDEVYKFISKNNSFISKIKLLFR